jgi:hypothetical protein
VSQPLTPFGNQSVEKTPEIKRIASLPRRVWSDDAATQLAAQLTKELKTPKGTMSLRPVQAVALYEVMEAGGLFGPIRVGGGKTLLTLLIPLVLEAKRPLLLLPAALVEKTWHDRKALAEHWRLPTNVQSLSYELLGLVQSAQKLDYTRPDLIVGDECHLLKNHSAGRTRRVTRYMRENPSTKFVGVSGTVMKGSIQDFAHILRWCLKDKAPVPATDDETKTWADALDEKVNPLARRKPGALFKLLDDFDYEQLARDVIVGGSATTRARLIFQARLLETPGVVASSRTDGVTCSLRVSALDYRPAPVTELHVANMKGYNDTKEMRERGESLAWTTPDGWTFSEAIELRRYIRELALGFHGVWDPRPPTEWISARRNWASFVRDTLAASRTLDTELQVVTATDAGTLPEGRRELGPVLLASWRAERDKPDAFKINAKPVWHDDAALQACVKWAEREKGIVWCEHVFFAKRLAQLSGCVYYGADGRNEAGDSITDVKSGRAIIASVQANSTGRNLQMFATNLVTSCPPGASTIEQLIGRTHRDGQEADTVMVDVLRGCREHHEAFFRAVDGAKAAETLLGHSQKLLLADLCFPSIATRTEPLWI